MAPDYARIRYVEPDLSLNIGPSLTRFIVGIGVITVYAVDLFQDAGFGLTLSKLLAGFNNISYMFSVIFAVITLDRYGRRCKYCPV